MFRLPTKHLNSQPEILCREAALYTVASATNFSVIVLTPTCALMSAHQGQSECCVVVDCDAGWKKGAEDDVDELCTCGW